MRYFVKLAYRGTQYHGWQLQQNALSVQEVVNKGFSVLLAQELELTGAGRTDTGVHARVMYAHFDTAVPFYAPELVHRLNSYLPKDIVVYEIFPVRADAHCRFCATLRTYEYFIHYTKNPFLYDQSYYLWEKLDIHSMNAAADELMRHEDFQCFSKVNTDVTNFVCNISEAHWQDTDGGLVFTISANRFLRNMVRSIVGTMINVGKGRLSTTEFRGIIESRDRNKAGFSVPAHGLYLKDIKYDSDEILVL